MSYSHPEFVVHDVTDKVEAIAESEAVSIINRY